MPEYRGIIKRILQGGVAEAEIVPEQAGIPGAPGVNVCHCASEGSKVTFKAENRAGAEVGDSVLINRKISGILMNALVLIGIPFLGVLVGLTAGLVLMEILNIAAGYLLVTLLLGLTAGIGVCTVIYRGMSDHSAFIVTEVINQGRSIQGEEDKYFCFFKDQSVCEKCTGK